MEAVEPMEVNGVVLVSKAPLHPSSWCPTTYLVARLEVRFQDL